MLYNVTYTLLKFTFIYTRVFEEPFPHRSPSPLLLFSIPWFFQIRKPMVERQRRKRMNQSISQLKVLIASTIKQSVRKPSILTVLYKVFKQMLKHVRYGHK